ncbi:helix-turn-helix domain-containing protein [Paenarthrobacter sp. NPDC057355]|uniref:helix-turn-helix domain-containing protein n=1 Tax=Paenarthrobacter sp. NPDC057355 TaxID=3346105 RepID=UPI0036447ADB
MSDEYNLQGERAVADQAEENQFAENVQRLRELKGWSQGELARRMTEEGWEGFHQTTISRIEKGQRPVRLAEARGLARVLGNQVGMMIAPPAESEILEGLAMNIGYMRLHSRRIWAELEKIEDRKIGLQALVHDVEKIPQEQWERLGLWEFVTQLVVQASHMQKWTPQWLLADEGAGEHGEHSEA